MSLRADHKALAFVGAIVVLGAGVRIIRAADGRPAVMSQPALEHQLDASDSARRQQKSGQRGRGRGSRRGARAAASGRGGSQPQSEASPSQAQPNRRGYVNQKLDLDVATAAQLDSLPGVTPTVAKRIIADRMEHG